MNIGQSWGDNRHGESRGNKRRFNGKGSPNAAPVRAPRRGPPAIFVTCEAGRESKCKREAMDLIHHYYYASRPATIQQLAQNNDDENSLLEKGSKPDRHDEHSLSLEEELAMLRKGAAAEEVLSYEPNSKRPRTASDKASSMKSPFSVYDTGMRGMVCILCTLPACEFVPYEDILSCIRGAKEKGGGTDATDENPMTAGGYSAQSESLKDSVRDDHIVPPWDPVETVRCIFRDAKSTNEGSNDTNIGSTKEGIIANGKGGGGENKPSALHEKSVSPPPGSRFISRMIPMQTTCYASVEEIKAVSISLLKRCLPKVQAILPEECKKITFKLEIKRRLCTHLTREDVIDAVTPVVLGGLEEMPGHEFSVNLSDPDFSIRIETCRTLCGISILPREGWYKNFNLAELNTPIKVDG